MLEVVFKTLEEAELLQNRDYLQHILTIKNDNFKHLTTAWSTIKQDINGNYTYFALDGADYSGITIREYSTSNYYTEE